MNKIILSTVTLSFIISISSVAMTEKANEDNNAQKYEKSSSMMEKSDPDMENKSAFNHDDWSEILKKHVKIAPGTTQVDYKAIKKDKASLKKYLNSLSSISQDQFDQWPKEDQLAFLLNAYNAWTVDLILTDLENIESIKDLGNFIITPWKKKFVPMFGDTVSLDHIEHTLIRGSGKYNDPRIHFAANCASIGCPALRQEAYQGHKLEEQLEEQTHFFLNDSTRNNIKGSTLNISSIFKWYRGDFEAGWRDTYTLQEFIYLYKDSLSLTEDQESALELDELKENFLPYDWKLNKVP